MRLLLFLVFLVCALVCAACSSTSPTADAKGSQRHKATVQLTTAPKETALQATALERRSASYQASTSTRGRPQPRSSTGGAGGVTGDYAGYPAVERLIDRLVREEGFDRGYLERVFSRVDRKQWIVDFVNRPKAKGPSRPTGAWTRYRAKFLTTDNIARGGRFWRRHQGALDRAYARYGVPPEYVVAIVGIETRYGGILGKHRVIDALSTLAFDFPRRSEFFTGELEAFLVMSRDEGFDPFKPVGSYAGAMGLGQFMPTSFQRFAVDFDGDGKRDLWNPVDVVGSVANYFASHGWRTGELVAVRAKARGGEARSIKAGYDTSYNLEALNRKGILSTVAVDGDVSLLRLDAKGGYEYWLGSKNFYVITRYNHSSYYAMAVHQLAQALSARYGPSKRPVISRLGATQQESIL